MAISATGGTTSREQLVTSPITSTSWKPSQDVTTSGSSVSVRPPMKTTTRVQGKLLNEFYPFKTWMEEDVERAHRVGPKGNNQPRLLLARMHHWSDKLSLLSERTFRQNMANQVGVRVAADLTDRQQEELRKHREQGRTAYYRSGRLHVRERQPKRRDPASEVDKRLLESQLPPLADMDHYPALRRQQSPTDYQQSRAAASSGSRDRCVIQISPTSATTRGLPLRGMHPSTTAMTTPGDQTPYRLSELTTTSPTL